MTRIALGGSKPSGSKWPNYVNGRLLTATDLTTEQSALVTRDRRLGQAIGPGVVDGLEVSGSPGSSELHVSPGTGVCPGGTAVHLESETALDLTNVAVTAAAPTSLSGDRFAACRPPDTETIAPTAGAYVLVARPASSYDGKAPVLGGAATTPTPCTSRWELDEIAFAAVSLDGFAAPAGPDRRNALAHWCLGTDRLDELAMAGFATSSPLRGLDRIGLGPCDLALAVFDWDGSALRFVDVWSARRRPVRPPATGVLSEVVNDERTADGEARFLQFQRQLDALLATPAGLGTRARDVFAHLPPAGIVPIDPVAGVKVLFALAEQVPPSTPLPPPAPGTSTGSMAAAPMMTMMSMTAMTPETATGPTFGTAFGSAGGSQLGTISKAMADMQAEIAVLHDQVADLQAATGAGRGGSDGGRSRDSARVAGFKLADNLALKLADTPGSGVDPARFFSGITVRLGMVERETVDFTIRRSWYDEPIATRSEPTINVFFVVSDGGQAVAPYLLFVKRIAGISWIELDGRDLDR